MLNDIKAAKRVVSADDSVLEVTPEVLQALMLRHPSEPEDSVTPIIPAENIAVTADEKKIIRSIRSFSDVTAVDRRTTSCASLGSRSHFYG